MASCRLSSAPRRPNTTAASVTRPACSNAATTVGSRGTSAMPRSQSSSTSLWSSPCSNASSNNPEPSQVASTLRSRPLSTIKAVAYTMRIGVASAPSRPDQNPA
jgi:hypothetical protein